VFTRGDAGASEIPACESASLLELRVGARWIKVVDNMVVVPAAKSRASEEVRSDSQVILFLQCDQRYPSPR